MKVPDSELKQLIIDKLSEKPVYYPNRTRTQHVIRCESCGDSSNLSHAHLSIHIDVNDDLPMYYRCFRCNDSGVVTRDKLYDWGITLDDDEAASLKIYGKKSQKKYKNTFSDKFESYFATEIRNEFSNTMKLEYMNARLGSNFTLEEARKLKVIPSIVDFIKGNYLIPDKLHMTPQLIQNIESNYIGFLATNNNRIMFRNTKDILTKYDYRWYNVILNESNMNPYTFYSIPNRINMYYTHPIEIHVSEGIFDILSIYNNVQNQNTDNKFYYASCGSSALNVMNFLIDCGINTGLNLHLYADKDKSDEFHMKYLMRDSQVYQWCDSIYIHRNAYTGEKDYGVPSERIIDSYRKVYQK